MPRFWFGVEPSPQTLILRENGAQGSITQNPKPPKVKVTQGDIGYKSSWSVTSCLWSVCTYAICDCSNSITDRLSIRWLGKKFRIIHICIKWIIGDWQICLLTSRVLYRGGRACRMGRQLAWYNRFRGPPTGIIEGKSSCAQCGCNGRGTSVRKVDDKLNSARTGATAQTGGFRRTFSKGCL